jgi:predicted house-cleaning noncanonical NTP pyrophosphatase (MazG superfamily)
MSDAEHEAALRDKLVEEATEARDADGDHLLTELADLQEVMYWLMRLHGITPEMLDTERERRRTERGGFEQRLKLMWTE